MFKRFRKLSLFVVGVSVPIQGFAFGAGGLSATPFKLATGVLLVLAALQYAAHSGGRHRDRKTTWMIAFLVSFTVATIMALVAGLPPGPVLRSGTTMIALVSFYFLLGYVVETGQDVRLLLWALVIGGVVTVLPAAVGIQQSNSVTQFGKRFAGLSGQENLLGADMNVCLAAAAALFFLSRSQFRKMFLLGAGVLALAGIALSVSRSAMLALGAMWAFWMYRSGRRGNLQYVVLAMMIATGSLLFMPDSVMGRLDTVFNAAERARDGSIQGRLVVNAWALRAFISNPLLGVGAPRFATWMHEQPGTIGLAWHTIHNAYLSVAAQQGLLGLVPFVAVLTLSWNDYTTCWRAIRVRRLVKDPVLAEIGHLALFLQLALLSGLVGGLFHQQQRSKTMWMMMALSPVLLSLARERLETLRESGSRDPARYPDPYPRPDAIPGPSWG